MQTLCSTSLAPEALGLQNTCAGNPGKSRPAARACGERETQRIGAVLLDDLHGVHHIAERLAHLAPQRIPHLRAPLQGWGSKLAPPPQWVVFPGLIAGS